MRNDELVIFVMLLKKFVLLHQNDLHRPFKLFFCKIFLFFFHFAKNYHKFRKRNISKIFMHWVFCKKEKYFTLLYFCCYICYTVVKCLYPFMGTREINIFLHTSEYHREFILWRSLYNFHPFFFFLLKYHFFRCNFENIKNFFVYFNPNLHQKNFFATIFRFFFSHKMIDYMRKYDARGKFRK